MCDLNSGMFTSPLPNAPHPAGTETGLPPTSSKSKDAVPERGFGATSAFGTAATALTQTRQCQSRMNNIHHSSTAYIYNWGVPFDWLECLGTTISGETVILSLSDDIYYIQNDWSVNHIRNPFNFQCFFLKRSWFGDPHVVAKQKRHGNGLSSNLFISESKYAVTSKHLDCNKRAWPCPFLSWQARPSCTLLGRPVGWLLKAQ